MSRFLHKPSYDTVRLSIVAFLMWGMSAIIKGVACLDASDLYVKAVLDVCSVFMILLAACSYFAPEGFLIRPILRVFPAKAHGFITWSIVYIGAFLMFYIPRNASFIAYHVSQNHPAFFKFLNGVFGHNGPLGMFF